MRARFRIRKKEGVELTPETLGAFTRLVKSGEIEEADLIYDALTGEWAPARSHPVYRMMLDGVAPEIDLGLSVAPRQPDPSPEDTARAFIAQMEEARRADPDRPEQPLALTLLDRGASSLSRDERPEPSPPAPETAKPKCPHACPKPKRRRGSMLLMVLGPPILAATLIESLSVGKLSPEGRSREVAMSDDVVRALPARETVARQRAVETMQEGPRVLMSEVQAGAIPAGRQAGRLDGRYLSSTREHEHVRVAWYA